MASYDCPDCGQSHPRGCHGHVRRCHDCDNAVGKNQPACRKCGSTNIDERVPCRAFARKAMTVCNDHGGASPQAERSARQREQFRIARDAADTYGVPREIDPRAALEEELWRTAGVISFYELIVRSSEIDELKQYTTDDDGRRWEKPSVWIELLERERRHYVNVAKTAASAGIEERRVQMTEAQGAAIVAFTRSLLAALGRDDPEAHQIAAAQLRLVETAA